MHWPSALRTSFFTKRPTSRAAWSYSQLPSGAAARTGRAGSVIGSHATAVDRHAYNGENPAIAPEEFILKERNHHDADSDSDSQDEDAPTQEEKETLRRVSDTIPWSAFLVAIIELCERFAYYGFSGPFQNYIQNSPTSTIPGALGLGQQGATGLVNFFQFWCYLTPICGAVVADQYLGRYKTILTGAGVYMVGILILFITSLPSAIALGASQGGLIIAMIIIGVGTGAIKSNVSPLIAEQYTGTKQRVRTLRSGERVIVDPGVTIQRIYMIFYLCINLGSLSSIATTELEKHVGFWAAYFLPLCMFVVGVVVLVLGKKSYVTRPPTGSIIPNAFKAIWIGACANNLDAAKPSYQSKYGRVQAITWNDAFVDELRSALLACKVFAWFPIYWVAYGQMLNNFISQAGQMQLHGIPNDIMQNIDPLTIITFIPILDYGLYPILRKFGIAFRPITRIFMGFLFGALAMAYAAMVQHLIYNAGPCYESPLACPAGKLPDGGYAPNNIHVAVQTPAYLFIGLSEIFASITGLEYAFTKAPASMKSLVMSMFLLTSAFGAALQEILVPTAVDPTLQWMYAGLGVATLITGVVFWFMFRQYNTLEEEYTANSQSRSAGSSRPSAATTTTWPD